MYSRVKACVERYIWMSHYVESTTEHLQMDGYKLICLNIYLMHVCYECLLSPLSMSLSHRVVIIACRYAMYI